MIGKEIRVLGAMIILFAAAVTGVWLHRFFIETPLYHKLLPFMLMLAMCIGVRFTLLQSVSLREIVSDYFKEKAHPLNLAVFRITLFLFLYLFMPFQKILFFGRLPGELILPPTGTEWFLSFVPINESSIYFTYSAFRFFCLTAAFGLFTRFSALMVTILGFYVLGIPQFFGKVNHYNHLIWFSLILSGSRSGDYLSIDALIRAIRRPQYIPQESNLYALPLRMIWILIGIIYFFPGFWKYYDSGYAWIFGNNLQLKLYANWFWKPSSWAPPFLLTEYPFLCKLLGTSSIFFELAFIGFIFLPHLRIYVVVGGLIFHNLTKAFMGILFFSLQICYVAFFNWYKIFHRIAGLFIKSNMCILYDGNCKLCQRTIAVLRVIDIFHHVRYVNVLEPQAQGILQKHHIDQARALETMHVIRGQRVEEGFLAYRMLAFRYPLFWPIVPFLYIWPIPTIGKKIYQRVAQSRHCSVKPSTPIAASSQERPSAQAYAPIIGIGLFLIIINAYFGFDKNGYAWPFSCYPTFSNTTSTQTSTLWIGTVNQKGEEIKFTEKRLSKGFSFERYKGLVNRSLKIKDLQQRNKRLRILWSMIAQNSAPLKDVKSVRFYSVTFSILPEEKNNNPLDKKLIYEWSTS